MTTALLHSIQQEDWMKKPLTIIVVPGLSHAATREIYPALLTLFQSNLTTDDFEVWALDTRAILTETLQQDYIQPCLQTASEDFLECCIYKHISQLDNWRTLTQLLQQTSAPNQNIAIWLADSQQNHILNETIYMAHKRITPSILQGWYRVLFEPPLFRKTKLSWDETTHVYRLHPLVASKACQQMWAFRQRPWMRSMWNARAVQAVYVHVRTKSSYVYSMLPQLYHVLACIAMDMPHLLDEVSIQMARAQVLERISPYCRSIDLLTGKKTIEPTTKPEPTYVCVRCWVPSDSWAGVPFFLEIMQDQSISSDTVNVRLALRDAASQDALEFGEKGGQFIMAAIDSNSPDSHHLVEMNMTDDSDAMLHGRSRLALDVFRGKKTMFVHAAEIEAIHAIVDPLVRQCKSAVAEEYEDEEGPPSRQAFMKAILPPTSIEQRLNGAGR